jgi:hypothetical protein
MLITINSATWYSVMQPHRATLRRHPLQRYAAVDLIERPKLTRVSSGPEACAGNSNLLKTPFRGNLDQSQTS